MAQAVPRMLPTAIRMATAGDAEPIRAIYAPIVCDTHISFETEPPTIQEMRQRIRDITERWPWLVSEDEGRVTGYAYASELRERAAYRWSVEVTVYVREDCHRRGIGRALYSALFPALKLQGYHNAFAIIALPNPGSVGLHESMGFHLASLLKDVGYKLGAWRDVGWWQLQLQDCTGVPGHLLSVQEVSQQPQWSAAIGGVQSYLRLWHEG